MLTGVNAYQLPEVRAKRAAGFGHGDRFKATRKSKNLCLYKLDVEKQTPSPDAYRSFVSDFEKQKNKKHVFTFGASREAYDKVYLESNRNCTDYSNPGPG